MYLYTAVAGFVVYNRCAAVAAMSLSGLHYVASYWGFVIVTMRSFPLCSQSYLTGEDRLRFTEVGKTKVNSKWLNSCPLSTAFGMEAVAGLLVSCAVVLSFTGFGVK